MRCELSPAFLQLFWFTLGSSVLNYIQFSVFTLWISCIFLLISDYKQLKVKALTSYLFSGLPLTLWSIHTFWLVFLIGTCVLQRRIKPLVWPAKLPMIRLAAPSAPYDLHPALTPRLHCPPPTVPVLTPGTLHILMSLLPQHPPPSPLVGLGVEITASRAKPNLWQAAFRGKAGSPPWSPTSQHRALLHPVLVRPSSDGNNSRLRAISRWSPVSNTGLNLSGHWIPVALVLGSVKQQSGTEEKEGLFCIAWENSVLEREDNSHRLDSAGLGSRRLGCARG